MQTGTGQQTLRSPAGAACPTDARCEPSVCGRGSLIPRKACSCRGAAKVQAPSQAFRSLQGPLRMSTKRNTAPIAALPMDPPKNNTASLPGACRLLEEHSSTVCVWVFPSANSQLHTAGSQKAAELKASHQAGAKPPRTAGEQELGASSWGKRGRNEAQLHHACPLPWRLKSLPGAKPAEKGFCERVT